MFKVSELIFISNYLYLFVLLRFIIIIEEVPLIDLMLAHLCVIP